MDWTDISGHEEIIKRLRTIVANDQFPHAVIFSGARGIGKHTLARITAAALLCESSDAPCGRCQSCRAIRVGTHPDLFEIEPDTSAKQPVIKIGQIRQLLAGIALAPVISNMRVIIIDDAHLMNGISQNSILKTIEEPVGRSAFILVTDRRSELLITLRSRCMTLTFDRLTVDQIVEGLRARGIDEPKMVVPNDIGGKRIVGVGKAAYKGCLNIVSLIVSDGIEFLESEAFYGCRNLSDVQLPKTLKRIGGSVRDPYSGSIAGAFEETVITDIVLPERLEMLGARTFQHCINLKRIAIPVGITTIADMCFCGCSSLFVVVMPQKLTGINRCAFYSCNNLKHVALPPEVQTIGASAFHGCYALSDLQLNDGLQSIEAYAFDKCPNLHDVRIPRSVSKIEGCAFGSRPQKDNKDVTLRCYPGTAGLDYARENGFRIRAAE